jgi:hypothetical protein
LFEIRLVSGDRFDMRKPAKGNCKRVCMRVSWKVVSAALGSLAIVSAMGVGLLAFIFWPHCDRDERILATQTEGRSVVSCLEACTGLGTILTQSIELRSATGDRKTILQYEPTSGIVGCGGKRFPTQQEPSIDWSNPQDIHISISVVYGISQKHDVVNGVHVTYDIGAVISRDCDLSPDPSIY